MFELIIIAAVLIVLVAYFRALPKEDKATQAALIRDLTTIGVTTALKTTKEAARVAYRSGEYLSNEVQLQHREQILATKKSIDALKAEHGDSAVRVGIHYGTKIADAAYIAEANDNLAKILKDQETRKAALASI